jgi:phosphoribosylformylglycinamidine cyclo-ligase
MIQAESKTDWREMYKVFNMGHRLELYVSPEHAVHIIEVANSFDIDAQIIGRVEDNPTKKLTLTTPNGTFEYA